MTNEPSTNAVTVAVGAAAGLTAASFITALTQWFQLGTAILGFICALYAAYKLFFKK